MRKFKIWYWGRFPLAKKIRKRIIINALYEYVKRLPEPISVTPKEFDQVMNAAQAEYFSDIQLRRALKNDRSMTTLLDEINKF